MTKLSLRSTCYCTYCGMEIVIYRDKYREKYHIKDLYCSKCEHITPHIESRDVDFWTEKDLCIFKKGILAYYYERYGVDFLKFLLYVKDIPNHKESARILKFINKDKNMLNILEHYPILKKIMEEYKKRQPKQYHKIYNNVDSKSIFINYQYIK